MTLIGGSLDEATRSGVHAFMERSTASVEIHATSDTLTFELFFEAERRRLFRALYVMTGSAHEAEEIAQDAFLRICVRWDRASARWMTRRIPLSGRDERNRYRRVVRAARVQFVLGGTLPTLRRTRRDRGDGEGSLRN